MAEPQVFDEFVLSVPADGLSLSVTSYLFLADTFESEVDLLGIYENVKLGQLWILPSTVNLQIVVCIEGATLVEHGPCDNILEFLTDEICHSPLWDSLGLSATCTGISYETTDDEPTNIYLEVDHPDKAASLLSPPGAVTTSIEGVVCHLDYRPIVHGRQHRQPQSISDQTSSHDEAITQVEGCPEDTAIGYEIDEMGHRRRTCTAQLVVAALYRLIGIRPKFFGVQGITPASPTLLDVAPAMWNAHYMQLTRLHCRQLPVISNIIRSAATWRPTMQEKIASLSNGDDNEIASSDETDTGLQHNLRDKHLWALLRSRVNNKIQIQAAAKKAHNASGVNTDDLETRRFSDNILPMLPEDDGGESVDYGYDDGGYDESQLPEHWSFENNTRDHGLAGADIDNWSIFAGHNTYEDEYADDEDNTQRAGNESMPPFSRRPCNVWDCGGINPARPFLEEQHLQSNYFNRGQDVYMEGYTGSY